MKTVSLALFAAVAFTACRDVTPPPPAPAGAKYVVSFPALPPVVGGFMVVKAQLVDESGAIVRLADRLVQWSASAGTLPPVCLAAPVGCQQSLSATNADGIATINLTLSTVAGISYSISVVDNLGMSGASDQVTSIAGPPAQYVVILADTAALMAGSTIAILAQLADQYGNKIGLAGRTVTWSTATPGAGSFAAPTSTTDANGIATVKFTVGGIANTNVAVIASDDQSIAGTSLSISVIAGPASRYVVSVDSSESNPPAGAPVTVFAQLSDANGNAVATSARSVLWSFTGAGGSLSAPLGMTEANGGANVVFTTSNGVGASYTVSVTDAGGLTGTSGTITTQPQVSLSSIATGFESASVCGASSAGELWCWGANDAGQLGFGGAYWRYLPIRGGPNLSLASVSVGSAFACGLTSAGAAYCWGNNADGELGDGSQTSHSLPTRVSTTVTFQSISAGGHHACAVAVNGDAYCWGSNSNGRLGAPTNGIVTTTPVKVSGGLSFVAVSAGGYHTCGIITGGSAYCWGLNSGGQLGDGTNSDRAAPVAVIAGLIGVVPFVTLSAGNNYTCGVSKTGAGQCWGDNSYGQLGVGTQYRSTTAPVAVAGSLTLGAIAAGGVHTCALDTVGLAYCWGDNSSGELGNTNASSSQPVSVAGGLRFTTIGASSSVVFTSDSYYGNTTTITGHSCGITTGGTAYCWGSNGSGALGVGRSQSWSQMPLKVAGQR
jgi:alpha-tubulin suppressor-like RCC1 family protein